MAITSEQSYFYGQPSNINQLIQAIQNPYKSSQYQQQFQTAQNSLRLPFQQQQQGLTDMFRQAGNMASGAFGTAGANLAGQQANTLGQIGSGIAGNISSGLTSLLNALKLQTRSSVPENMGSSSMLNNSLGNYAPGNAITGQLMSSLGGGGGGNVGNYQPGNVFDGGGSSLTGAGTSLPGGGTGAPSSGSPTGDYFTYSPDGSVAQGQNGEIYVNGVYQGNANDPNMGGGAPAAGLGNQSGAFGNNIQTSSTPYQPTQWGYDYLTNNGGGFNSSGTGFDPQQILDALGNPNLSTFDFSL